MIRKLGLDHNHALNRDLRPIVQHNVHDLRIDEYVLDPLVAQQINHQTHECISAGYTETIDRPTLAVQITIAPLISTRDERLESITAPSGGRSAEKGHESSSAQGNASDLSSNVSC